MQLPPNWLGFKTIVLNNVRLYCITGIWPFRYENFTAWLNNFKDEKDEYLALHLIDCLIVRSQEMAKVGYAKVLHSEIRQVLIDRGVIDSKITIPKWKKKLIQGGLESKIRFAPIHTEQPAGESGNIIYRMISSEVDTNKYSLASATTEPNVIVLVDDFIGGGTQFNDQFAVQFELNNRLQTQIIIYCPLIAYEEGINSIRLKYPELIIIPVEIIYKTDSLFHGLETDFFRNDTINTVKDVREHLITMKSNFSPNMPNWLGFNNVALPIVFEWGCPNQAPSILWMNNATKADDWQNLFGRRR